MGDLVLIEKVAGLAVDRSLQVFSWSPAFDWSAFSVSLKTDAAVAAPPTA